MTSRLTPPVSKRDHTLGPASARITLVEFGDFECPFCAQAHPVARALLRLEDAPLFAFRHFPLTSAHPHAQHAAEAAEAAGAQGMFWEMHDVLFENQDALEDENLLEFAAALGLDTQRFVREMKEHVYAPRVREDFLSGVRSGVNGTPSFFIDGIRYDGPLELRSMYAAIEAATA